MTEGYVTTCIILTTNHTINIIKTAMVLVRSSSYHHPYDTEKARLEVD